MLAGLSAVAGSAMVGGALPVAAQQGKPVVGLRYQNFKRGTIHSLDPATRGLVIVWEDLGRVKLKAADLVINYAPGGTKETTGLASGLKVARSSTSSGTTISTSSSPGRRPRFRRRPGRWSPVARGPKAFPTASSRSG